MVVDSGDNGLVILREECKKLLVGKNDEILTEDEFELRLIIASLPFVEKWAANPALNEYIEWLQRGLFKAGKEDLGLEVGRRTAQTRAALAVAKAGEGNK